jgi:hypothetical protein
VNQIVNDSGKKGFNNDNATPARSALTTFSMGGQLTFEPKVINYDVKITVSFTWSSSIGASPPAGTFLFIQREIVDEGLTSEVITDTTLRTYNPAVEGAITDEKIFVFETATISSKVANYRFRIQDGAGNLTGQAMNIWMTEFSFTGELVTSGFPSSFAEMNYIRNAVDKNLEMITGSTGLLNSDFFGVGGAAELFAETNGYRLRANGYPVIATLKQRLDGLRAIFGTGYGLEQDSNYELTRVRLEPMEYFYQDVQMVAFTDLEENSYSEEFYEPLNFNRIEIGYKKFADNDKEPASLNDFCTQAQYKTPVVRLENEYTQLSDYIASDILGELTRRAQFNIGESAKNDDDLFIFDLVDTYPLIEPRTDSNDPIMTASGIKNITTSWNQRLNVRFNLFNHSALINSTVYKKGFGENYTCQFYKNNDEQNRSLLYESPSSSTPLQRTIGDPQTGGLSLLDGSISIGRFNGGLRLFDPIKISFKTAMTQTEVNNIISGHRNGLPTKNYGYVTVTDPDGVNKNGWLLSLSYNTINEIGSFEILKKADNYGN